MAIEVTTIESGITTHEYLTALNTNFTNLATGLSQTLANATIQKGTFTSSNLANGAITTAKIQDGAINTNQIKENAITTAKIADGNITKAKLQESLQELIDSDHKITFGVGDPPTGSQGDIYIKYI